MMVFHSILFERTADGPTTEASEPPDFFVDLNLDQIVDAITAGKQAYNLKPFFYTSLKNVDSIEYRHEIMQDLENKTLFENIKSFAQKMRTMREHLAQADQLYYKYQQESWFVDAVEIYCDAVNDLARDLSLADLKSRGFLAFRDYVTNYTQSDRFTSLLAETEQLKADLATVQYSLLIRGNKIQVRRYDSEIDYSTEVEKTFEKFKQGAVKDYRAEFSEWPNMNHVEAQILNFVAQLYPDVFLRLDTYCEEYSEYLDATIARFDREVQFYVAYLSYIARFEQTGLTFCYPKVSNPCKEVYDYDGFDLALAGKLLREESSIVCNDFHLEGKERIFVISGPNQGGKTTFARTFGQLHYLASLGCPVPGRKAQLFLSDGLFTHFEREEDIQNLRGKLQDDLVRIRDILNRATPNSIIILNEVFTSTTSQDALFLSERIMEAIVQLDALCIWVTFMDELASFSEKTVSMVSTVVPDNPARRTYKIVRQPADGLAYAIAIARKHRLTYDQLKERLTS